MPVGVGTGLEQARGHESILATSLERVGTGLEQAWSRLGTRLEQAWNGFEHQLHQLPIPFRFAQHAGTSETKTNTYIYIYIYVYRYIPWGSLAARSYASIVMATVDTVTSLVTLGLVRLDGPSSSHITPLLCTSLGPTSPPHLWTPWGSHDVSSSQNLFL